jgi:heme oxygenase
MHSLLKSLKTETIELHDEVMSYVPLLNVDLNLDQYRSHLKRMISLYAPLEANLLVAIAHLGDPFGLSIRLKSDWLRSDLFALDVSEAEINTLSSQLECEAVLTMPEFIGTLYVLEGSTLGGQVIRRSLLTRLPFAAKAMRFYTGYGDRTATLWGTFRTIAQNLVTEQDIPASVSSAKATFQRFITALKH